MCKSVLVHKVILPHTTVEYRYKVESINNSSVITKELGNLPVSYLSTPNGAPKVINSSIFYLDCSEEHSNHMDALKSRMAELLRTRALYLEQIQPTLQKLEYIDQEIKKVSKEMGELTGEVHTDVR